MEQLQTIFWERNSDITQLKQQSKTLKKPQYHERQRLRIQRQNWILKIIKTIKIHTVENKKNIYSCVIRMMEYYGYDMNTRQIQIDYQKKFTQELINLFIPFYTKYRLDDMNVIKKIIRPNNSFIIMDLIKQLIQTHRQYYKVKLMEAFKQITKPTQQKSKIKLFPVVMPRRQLPITQPSQTQDIRKQFSQNIHINDKIRYIVYEKWQNCINYNMPSEQYIKNYMNDTYLQLLQRNTQNNFLINKFQQKCYGKARNFIYNISSLYTQDQIKKIENKMIIDIKQKFSHIQQLKGNPSMQQLKQYFKIKVEIQENYDKIYHTKLNDVKINQFVPIVVQKSGFQHCPLNLFIYFGRDLIPIQQFGVKCGLSLKNYIKMIIKNKIQELNLGQNYDIKNLKRHHFLDINHAKKKQLMNDQHRVYDKAKKQSIFPMLRSNQLRQQTEIAMKNRSLSQYKLIPLFKNDLITRKLDQTQPLFPQQSQNCPISSLQLLKFRKQLNLDSSLRKKLNISNKNLNKQQNAFTWQKNKQSAKNSKSKIDDIIQLIINQRNMAIID